MSTCQSLCRIDCGSCEAWCKNWLKGPFHLRLGIEPSLCPYRKFHSLHGRHTYCQYTNRKLNVGGLMRAWREGILRLPINWELQVLVCITETTARCCNGRRERKNRHRDIGSNLHLGVEPSFCALELLIMGRRTVRKWIRLLSHSTAISKWPNRMLVDFGRQLKGLSSI